LTAAKYIFFGVVVTVQLAIYRQSVRLGDKPLEVLLALASAVILRSESRGNHNHILLSQIRDSPNPESQVPIFISPRIRVVQLYPQALGSLFVASYDSQGYGGGIESRLDTRLFIIIILHYFCLMPANHIEITASNSFSISVKGKVVPVLN
jgi:hypothetical protein